MIIDSHTLLWWLEGSEELSETARGLLDQGAAEGERFRVCAVTFWEMRLKEVRGRFQPTTTVSAWPGLLGQLDWFSIEPTSLPIWLKTADLDWDHRDPADRIIAATALLYGEAVLTKDRRFHEAGCPVKAVW